MGSHHIFEFDANNIGNAPGIKINSSTDDVRFFIDSLKAEMSVTTPGFLRLKELCFELVRRLPLPVQRLQDTFILRGRENVNGEVFSRPEDLSYNPYPDKITVGRFNLEREAVFYGTAPITSHNASGQLTAICEPCKELFDSASHHRLKYFTIGKWNIIKPVTTVVLTFFDKAEDKSWHLGNLNPHYLHFLQATCNEEDLDKCVRFYSFFSEYAAKKYDSNSSYLLTTAFFHALRQYYGEELAILYSSSMTENKGLNLALSKDLLDKHYLSFEAAAMFKLTRNPAEFTNYTIVPCTDYARLQGDNRFRFRYIS